MLRSLAGFTARPFCKKIRVLAVGWGWLMISRVWGRRISKLSESSHLKNLRTKLKISPDAFPWTTVTFLRPFRGSRFVFSGLTIAGQVTSEFPFGDARGHQPPRAQCVGLRKHWPLLGTSEKDIPKCLCFVRECLQREWSSFDFPFNARKRVPRR